MTRLDDLFTEIKHLAREAKDRSYHEAASVTQALNFARGHQWTTSGTPPWFEQAEQHPDAERSRLNFARRLIAAYASMITGSVRAFETSPRGATPLARLQALRTGAIIDGLWREDGDFFSLDQRSWAVYLAAVTGGAWVKVGYDPQKVIPFDGEPEGDIDVQVLTRNEVHPDPSARRIEDVTYIFHTIAIPIAAALTRYPVDAMGRPTDGTAFRRQTEDEVHLSAWSHDVRDRYSTHDGREGRNYLVEIVHCWWKPSRHFPAGMFFAYSGDRVLAMSPLPYEFPWVLIPGPYPVPWSIYPDSLMADLEDPQKDANEVAGRTLEWIKMCSAPTLLAHRETGVAEDEFTNLAGGVVRWTGNKPQPGWMTPPAPPGQLFDVLAQRFDLMKQQAAVSEINLGTVPTDDFSGRAVALLEDLQRSSHGAAFAGYQRAAMTIVRKMLKIAQRFWPEGRTIGAGGARLSSDVIVFRRAEFDADALIAIKAGEASTSRIAARAERLELFAAGVYDDTPAAQKMRASLSLAGEEPDNEALHREKALQENVMLAMGGHRPRADLLDDHEVHYFEHERAYLTETDPTLRRYLFEHMMEHQEAMVPMIPAPEGDLAGSPAAAAGPGAESPMNGGIGELEAISATGRSPGPGPN